MPNVVLTPHLGSAVLELREGMAHVVVDNTIALIEGRAAGELPQSAGVEEAHVLTAATRAPLAPPHACAVPHPVT